jgi:hypothetical protein
VASGLKMQLDATISVGDDPAPSYTHKRTSIMVDVDEGLLQHAISEDEQDEAWPMRASCRRAWWTA